MSNQEKSDNGSIAIAVIQLMRPHQWIKNSFVFAGLLFSRQWTNTALVIDSCLAVIAFCLASSAIYCLNDVFDRKQDQHHPTKKTRPVASGKISPNTAVILAICLIVPSLLIAWTISLELILLISAYALMNIAYCLRIKHVVLLDVFSISFGFILRILAGTTGIGIEPSEWMLLSTLVLTLFLGLTKRRAEILNNRIDDLDAPKRRVLQNYPDNLLDSLISITASCTIIFYGLYTISPSTIALHGTNRLIYTVPLVIYGLFRYSYLLYRWKSGEDTSQMLVSDKHLIAVAIVWAGSIVLLLSG